MNSYVFEQVFNDAVEALRVSYRKMNPFCVPFATTNMGSAMLAMDLGWMGPNYSISTACATSNFCILSAANHIIRGEADVMLSGGSDAAIIPIGLGGFVACRALSQRNEDPMKASRPWDTVCYMNIVSSLCLNCCTFHQAGTCFSTIVCHLRPVHT
jgi:3-oxoacyl-[acyl-carrier-protein] synthase II